MGSSERLTPLKELEAAGSPSYSADLYKEALELAYPLSLESYKEAERRLDVVEKRLQDLLAFAVTVTLGIIAVCAGKISFTSWPFYVAMSLCTAGLIVGVYARLSGHLILPSIANLYSDFLVKSDADFKLSFVAWAGQNDATNTKSIARKATQTNAAAIFFLLAAAFLALWAVGSSASSPRPDSAPSRPEAAGKARPAASVAKPAKGK